MSETGPHGMTLETAPIEVKAGPQRVTAAFVERSAGPIDDLMAPHEFTLADPNIGSAPGVTTLPHLKDLTITGPFTVTGVSDTVSRQQIFICRPVTAADEIPCATKIVTRLAEEAYRRPVTATDLKPLLTFFQRGRQQGNFESGIRMALQAILISPDFLFRLERAAGVARAGQDYRISDVALASRLSYFLWAMPPDAELVKLASAGRLHEPAVLDAQVHRMLRDPRSFALATRFAAQWLRLQDVDKVHPDAFLFPQYDGRLAEAMKQETENFFAGIVRDDRSVMDLLTANYTYVNQRLASFYGIPNVAGPEFRKVSLDGTHRRGLLGQGSILVETSVANRTDPVLRGKWVLEVLLGQPPPPPPPNVPPLSATGAVSADGKPLSVRQRMEEHRRSPFCASCHKMIDPIGLALENFDATGHWRIRDNAVSVDASTTLYDGTKMSGLDGLGAALLKHQDTFIRVFTENLMAYAIGRQIEYFDMPTVRTIVHRAAGDGNRFSSFVLGIVNSDAFRMQPDAHGHAHRREQPARAAFEGAVGRSEAMFITQKHLSRRTVLKGMGVTLALPFLDAMVPAGGAWAQTPAAKAMGRTRLVAMEMVHGAAGSADLGRKQHMWSPAATGTDFDLSPTSLRSLEPYRDYLTIVSGTADHAAEAWDALEVGGDHFRSSATFLTQAHPKQTEGSDTHAGMSIDQIYAKEYGQSSAIPSMQLCIEPVDEGGGCSYGYACVYMDTISWAAPDEPLPMIRNPRAVFDQMFGLGGSPADRAARQKANASLLDFVHTRVTELKQDLGLADRQRLDAYLNDVREIERRIQNIEAHNRSGEMRNLPEAPIGVPTRSTSTST